MGTTCRGACRMCCAHPCFAGQCRTRGTSATAQWPALPTRGSAPLGEPGPGQRASQKLCGEAQLSPSPATECNQSRSRPAAQHWESLRGCRGNTLCSLQPPTSTQNGIFYFFFITLLLASLEPNREAEGQSSSCSSDAFTGLLCSEQAGRGSRN